MTKNLELWNRVQETDPNFTTKVEFGQKFTSIDAMYQVRRATQEFGPVGTGWGYDTVMSTVSLGQMGELAVCDLTLWYINQGEKKHYGPIRACNKLCAKSGHIDEDAWKKALTDALTKALSHLGFSADVFLGMFDDNRYVETMKAKYPTPDELRDREIKQSAAQYIDGLRMHLMDNNVEQGLELIKELRQEHGDEAWIAAFQMLDTQEKKKTREWMKPGEKST